MFVLLMPLSLFASLNNTNPNLENDTANYPYWIEMMQSDDANFYDIQRAFNVYWEGREITKGCGWKPFKRWENYWQTRVLPDGSFPSPDRTFNAFFEYSERHRSSSGDWIELGPMVNPENGGGLGRINSIAFHPTDPQIIWAGAPSGGLWKTVNGGTYWTSNTDHLPTLGVSAIVIDPSNPDIIYIGTGDRDAGDARGLGVMKSFDGGVSWDFFKNGMGDRTVSTMIMHPHDPQIILAATSGGIYRTFDGGNNWSNTNNSGFFKDIVFKPDHPETVYATASGKFFMSSDTGSTWTHITSGLPFAARGVIGVTPAAKEFVYFLLTNSQSYKGLYLSTDGGYNFTEQSNSPNIMDWSNDGSGSGGQAWYDLDIAIDPLNPYIVYAGGVNIFQSHDGGQTWFCAAHWSGNGAPYVHADHHIFEFSPLNGNFYSGNDGGVFMSDDGGSTWHYISEGLAIGQVYKIGQSAKNKDQVINGYQDNGTAVYLGTHWKTIFGGDGFECIVDFHDPRWTYVSIYYGSIFKLYDYNYVDKIAGNKTYGITESGAWITPFIMDINDPNTMFIGYKNVWRSNNIKNATVTWNKISANIGTGNCSVLEQSPADNEILYVAKTGKRLYRTDNAGDTHPSWTDISAHLPTDDEVTDLETHPTDPDIVYMTLGNGVWMSQNKGNTWTSVKGTLPSVHKTCLVYDVNSPDGIYVGSDAGVYFRDASMNDWVPFYNGLPANVEITELEIFYDTNNHLNSKLRAGTYGRGMWESELYDSYPVTDFIADQVLIPVQCPVNFTDLTSGLPTEWKWRFDGAFPDSSVIQDPKNIMYDSPGLFDVTLIATNIHGIDTILKKDYIKVSDTLMPIADFIVNENIVCYGEPVIFKDASKYATSLSWSFVPNTVTFINGTGASSLNPQVIFNDPGQYSISLVASNANGSDTETKTDYIFSGGITPPFTEDFENGSLKDKAWTVENPDDDAEWKLYTVAGTSPGDKAAGVNLYLNGIVHPGERERLISPTLNLSDADSVIMTFDHAYTTRMPGKTDSLIIKVSNNCGYTWEKVFATGEDGNWSFATAPQSFTAFFPALQADWCGHGTGSNCYTIDMSKAAGYRDVKIMFEAWSGSGNNLFVDNINVEITAFSGINEPGSENEISVYPNPANDLLNIKFDKGVGNVEIELLNIHGKIVKKVMFDLSGGEVIHSMDVSDISPGIYFIRFFNKNFTTTVKLIHN